MILFLLSRNEDSFNFRHCARIRREFHAQLQHCGLPLSGETEGEGVQRFHHVKSCQTCWEQSTYSSEVERNKFL